MSNVNLADLRVGSKVKLRGTKPADPRKPWPRGWKEVAELSLPLGDWVISEGGSYFRIVDDERWLPVSLIEEIVNG